MGKRFWVRVWTNWLVVLSMFNYIVCSYRCDIYLFLHVHIWSYIHVSAAFWFIYIYTYMSYFFVRMYACVYIQRAKKGVQMYIVPSSLTQKPRRKKPLQTGRALTHKLIAVGSTGAWMGFCGPGLWHTQQLWSPNGHKIKKVDDTIFHKKNIHKWFDFWILQLKLLSAEVGF